MGRQVRGEVAAGGALCALLLVAGCGEGERGRPGPGGPGGDGRPVAVQVAAATARELPQTLFALGSIESPQTTRMAAEVPGRVEHIDIPEGALVEEGHVLVRLDDDETRAALQIARARYRNARDRLERARALRERGVSSEQELDDALTDFDAAEGALEEARSRLEKTGIRAPFDGILGLRQVHLGQVLEPGDPVVEITQVDPLDLHFGLPQDRVTQLKVGQRVLGRAGRCGERFEGAVAVIDPRVHSATRMVQLEASLPNPNGGLRPGMAAHVQVVVDTLQDAIVIPRAALVRRGTRHLVYTLDGDGRAHPQKVTPGEFFTDSVHVREGLAAGDRVVVSGQARLRPGAPVSARPYRPTENPNLSLGWPDPDEPGPPCEPLP